jgi:uncharacterized phiE125 gp8 family phage protein
MTARWDTGIVWYRRLVVPPVGPPVLDPATFAAEVLRVANGGADLAVVETMIRAAEAAAERKTKLALRPQTWEVVLSGFPAGGIRLPRSPLIAVEAIGYVDPDGLPADLVGSPAGYVVSAGGELARPVVSVADGGAWPATGAGSEVAVRFTAGFLEVTHPRFVLIQQGIALFAAELYKQRTLSVQQPNNTPATLQLEYFWETVP